MPVEVNETAILLALGRAITARRDELGLSQRGLATEAGLDRVFLRGIEDGTRKATVITLIRLATALDTTAAALVADGCWGAPDQHGQRSRAGVVSEIPTLGSQSTLSVARPVG